MNLKVLLSKKQKAKQEGNYVNILKYCLEIAEFCKSEGKFKEAIQEYEEMLKIYEDQKKPIDAGNIHRALGEIYSEGLTEPRKALKHQLAYLKIAKDEHNILEEQRALATLGRTYFCAATIENDGDLLEKAFMAYKKSFEICEKKLQNLVSSHEKNDMRARLLVNIANVLDHKNKIQKAIKYTKSAIEISKKEELFDSLELSYRTLAGLYGKQNDFQNALSYYRESYEIATRLSENRETRMCDSLSSQSEIFVKLTDFKSAKQVLLKAYKLKIPNKIDRDLIKKNLKIVTVLCRTEESLLKIPEDDHTQRKILYEKMGDGICELANYAAAIDYYKKMLKCVELKGGTQQELSAAYISLAQTYKDNRQYDLAIEYFHKDLELFCGKSEEVVESYLNIADVLVLAGKSYEEIEAYYQKARSEAQKAKSQKLEEKVITKLMVTQKRYGKYDLAEESKTERNLLTRNFEDGSGSDSDSSPEEIAQTKSIADEVVTSEISGASDESDNEENIKSRLSRSRRSGTSCNFKKNYKGETPLHVACIHGDQVKVEMLLRQKHPVNQRDNAGWLPIHEACLYGHKEIVKILIKAGAHIDDRGGKECKGTTPLHDACANFHLDVVELLLDSGASPLIKNDDNQTALDILEIVAKNFGVLDESSQAKFDAITKRLKDALKKVGKLNEDKVDLAIPSTSKETPLPFFSPPKKTVEPRARRLSNNLEVANTNISPYKYYPVTPQKATKQKNRKSPRRLTPAPENSPSKATLEYKQAIDSVRRRYSTPEKPVAPCRKSNSSSHVTADDVDDDWLVDDMPNESNRKRKVASSMNGFDSTVKLKKCKSLQTRKTPIKKSHESNGGSESDIEMIIESNIPIEIDGTDESDHVEAPGPSMPPSTSRSSLPRKLQTTLLKSGFTRHKSNDSTRSNEFDQLFDNGFNSASPPYNPDSTTIIPTQSSVLMTNLTAVDVHIENKIWKIPISTRNINCLTIAWLAEEASKRYYSKEGVKPNLQLETKEHAILDDNDPLEMVLMYKELYSKVISWNLPSIVERYLDAYKDNKSGVDFRLKNCLDVCQATLILNISDLSLTHNQIVPVLKALKHQKTLEELNLSGNLFTNDTMKILCEVLPTLSGLQRLNLSSTLISWESISCMSDMFVTNLSRAILPSLNTLDLSYNNLGDNSIKFLISILKYVKIKSLNLASVHLTDNLFQNGVHDNYIFNLNEIEYFNLSDNPLNEKLLQTFLKNINPNLLKTINLSGVTPIEGGASLVLANSLRPGTPKLLQHIDLSRCCVDDFHLKELLNCFGSIQKIETLNLSANVNLTGVSFRLLWESKLSFTTLILENCSNICLGLTNDDISLIIQEIFTSNALKRVHTLKITLQNKLEIDMITNLWRGVWNDNSVVYKGFGKAVKYDGTALFKYTVWLKKYSKDSFYNTP